MNSIIFKKVICQMYILIILKLLVVVLEVNCFIFENAMKHAKLCGHIFFN